MKSMEQLQAEVDRQYALIEAYIMLSVAKEIAMGNSAVSIEDYETISHAVRFIEKQIPSYPYEVAMTIRRYIQMTSK
jgi:phosphate uptake regulator